MAALMQKALDEIDTSPDTLSEALACLDALHKIADAGLEQIIDLSETNSNLEDRLAEVEGELEDVKDERDAVLEGAISDLEAVRQMIKTHRYDEALHVLERILQTSDPDCKRMTTVVPPIHGGGFL